MAEGIEKLIDLERLASDLISRLPDEIAQAAMTSGPFQDEILALKDAVEAVFEAPSQFATTNVDRLRVAITARRAERLRAGEQASLSDGARRALETTLDQLLVEVERLLA